MALVVMNNTRKSVHRRPSYSIEYGKVVTWYVEDMTRLAGCGGPNVATRNVWKSSVAKGPRVFGKASPDSNVIGLQPSQDPGSAFLSLNDVAIVTR